MDKATQEKAVREMCEILMDSEVDFDDKHSAFVTLMEVLFPEHCCVFWEVAIKILCEACQKDSAIIVILEAAARKSLLPRDEIDEIARGFGVVIDEEGSG